MALTSGSKILASDVSGKIDTAGTGLSKSGTTLSLATSGVTAGSYGPSANATPSYGSTFNVPYVTVDTYGRVTGCSTKTVKIPAAPTSVTAMPNVAVGTVAGGSNITIPSGGTWKLHGLSTGRGVWIYGGSVSGGSTVATSDGWEITYIAIRTA